MIDKFDYYGTLSTIILGSLLLGSVSFLFPWLMDVRYPAYPEAFAVILLTSLVFFLGQLVQALASFVQPGIYKSFGGRPSDQALTNGLKGYIKADAVSRIKRKLRSATNSNSTDHSLFAFAMQCAESAEISRTSRFNSLYAYHRGLVVLIGLVIIMFLASTRWGVVATWPQAQISIALVTMLLIFLLVWYRTKQRACYYVREVLLTTERILDERTTIVESMPTSPINSRNHSPNGN